MKYGKITIAAVGKIKKDHWQSAQADYLKRLKRYCTVRLLEVRDAVGKGSPDRIAIQKEGLSLLEVTNDIPFRIAVTVKGRQPDSLDFAEHLRKWLENLREMAFIIGGPAGLSNGVLQQSQFHLSLSPLTFPHELARILLLEQLYRAATIIHKHKYHK
jgi:23S rRNA (pseudouridine1915-N3)-methyltransferase